MIPKPLSRLLVVGAVVPLALSGGTSAQTAAPADRALSARDLLASPAARFITPMGLTELAAMAGTTPVLGANASAGDHAASSAVGRPAATPEAAIAPSELENVRVNDPREDVHQQDQTTQSETSIAVTGGSVVVGFNDSQRALLLPTAGASLSGYAYSANGGESFVDGGALPNTGGCINSGDPWLTADRAGAIYYSNLVSCANGGFVAVARSTDGGRTFSPPTVILPQTVPSFFFADKPALTAGADPATRGRDNLYDTWDDFSVSTAAAGAGGGGGGGGGGGPVEMSGLAVARSVDAGGHWSVTYAAKVPLVQPCPGNPNAAALTQYLGAQPVVDPATGVLFVASEKISQACPSTPNAPPSPTKLTQVIFTSKDGGQHFGPETTIADAVFSLPTGQLELAPGRVMRNADFPTLAMLGSNLFAAWNDGRSGRSHIALSRSSDGVHWSAPVSVTSGSGDDLQPALSADGSSLQILYYHRNANNTLDVHLASSSDGSNFTFRRVTDQSFPGALTFPQADPVIAQTYMGDYIANVAAGGHRYFAWGDNRDTVTSFMYPDGRPDPNVFLARQ
jgi:hypothetical protein